MEVMEPTRTASRPVPCPGPPPVPSVAVPTQQGSSKLHNNPVLMALFAALLIALGAHGFTTAYNFDVFYMLATGREILQNGIPYVNPFSIHEGASIIVQQWGLCLLLYGLYSAGGMLLLALWTVLMSAALMVSLYRLLRLFKRDLFGGELIMAVTLIAFAVCSLYITMCSSVYSMIAFCWVLFFCEKYRQTRSWKWLIFLLPLATVHSAFHMSLALFDLVIIACYALPDIFAPFHRRHRLMGLALFDASYKRIPLWITLLGTALALCINPYGVKGALYLVLSYGAADYGNAIPEMNVLSPMQYGIAGYTMIVLVFLTALAIGKNGAKHLDGPLLILFAGTVCMAFLHTRNIWLFAPFSAALIATAMQGWSADFARCRGALGRFSHSAQMVSSAVILSVSAIATVFAMVNAAPTIADVVNKDGRTPTPLMEAFDEEVTNRYGEDVDKSEIRLFNPTALGGYLEWYGYPVFMDSRVETWNDAISGLGKDHYNEYIDLMAKDTTPTELEALINEYDFDYMFTEPKTPLDSYLREGHGYTSVIGTDGYTLWRKAQ